MSGAYIFKAGNMMPLPLFGAALPTIALGGQSEADLQVCYFLALRFSFACFAGGAARHPAESANFSARLSCCL